MLLERLLENFALSVEAFATCRVAPGWRLRLPALDWVTLHYVLAGQGAVRDADGTDRVLPGGSLAIVPPHLLHSLQCGEPPFAEVTANARTAPPAEMPNHVAGLEGDDPLIGHDPLVVVCGQLEVTYGGGIGLFDRLDRVLIVEFSDDETMRATFSAMLEEVTGGRPGSRAMTSTLMRGCLIRLFRALCHEEECSVSWLGALDDPSLASVVQTMLDRPADPHSVDSLARQAFMSRSAFARRFKLGLGQPPLEFLRGIRLRYAARLLKRSPALSIPVVAQRSGFASRSQFSRAFRREFGRPPSEFRDAPS